MSELDKYRSAVAQLFRDIEATRCLGTGFLISDQGHVITCWHVVEDKGELPKQVFVRFADQERVRSAAVLADRADKALDYIVLQVEGPTPQPVPFGPGEPGGTFYAFGFRKH